MTELIIGMDNGTTASYTAIDVDGNFLHFGHVPTFQLQKWTKPKKDKKGKLTNGHITVIDIKALKEEFTTLLYKNKITPDQVKCYLERPAVGFSGWSVWTSLSGIAAWVAVQYVLLDLGIEYFTIDSREWQENLIPQALGTSSKKSGTKTKRKAGERNKALKIASDELALNLYPEATLKDSGDGDSICIAYNYYLKEVNKL